MICKFRITQTRYSLSKFNLTRPSSLKLSALPCPLLNFKNLPSLSFFSTSNLAKPDKKLNLYYDLAFMDQEDKKEFYINFCLQKFGYFSKNNELQTAILKLKNKISSKTSYNGYFAGKLIDGTTKVTLKVCLCFCN